MNSYYKGAIVVAAPGAVGAWGLALIRDAAAAFDPPLKVSTPDRLDGIDHLQSSDVIFVTQYPDASIQRILKRGLLPIVAFVDDAVEAMHFLVNTADCSFIDALRSASCGAVLNPMFAHSESTLVIRRGDSSGCAQIIKRVLAHISLRLSKDKVAELTEKYCGRSSEDHELEASLANCVSDYRTPGSWHRQLSEDEDKVTAQALVPLVNMSLGEERAPITWPPGLFISGDNPNEKAPIVADVTGAARTIYYGPYLCLPPGNWDVEIAVGFSKEAVGLTFTVDVFGTEVLAQGKFRATQTGLFRGSFKFENKDFKTQLEVRFRTNEGAIDGKFGLAWVKLFYRGTSSQRLE